jgi:poly-beta-1,6-N-acetyl-D-glucosamine synthase
MTFLFLLSAGIFFQAYVAYPLSLILLRRLIGDRSGHRSGHDTPSISLVISAYNEERVIRQKLENSLALDYPADRIDRIVVSDGSTDGTEAIVREFAGRGVELRSLRSRQGKVACLNQVLPGLRSELVVMSDANSMYERDSLRKLVRHFADPKVGCVCGQLGYVNPRGLPAGEGERLYWRYEGLIKRLESAIGSLLGANGAIYAYRRRLFRPVDPLMFCDDLIPIRIALGGSLTLYDPEARCTEQASDEGVEMRRRRRHASFGLRSMLQVAREAVANRRPLVLYQCASHRILRWLGWFALVGILVSSPFLSEPWRSAALVGQAVFYGAAGAGFLASRLGLKAAPLYLPYYFLVLTLAGLLGVGAFLLRRDRPYWEPRQ